MRLTSPSLADGDRIPTRHSGDGDDLSPPLSWADPPEGTAEFVLIVDDPDAPRPTPWVHWLLYDIPADVRELEAGIPRSKRLDEPHAAQGRNSWEEDNIGYRGPAPPRGHGPHRYRFTLYALDEDLDLEPGADRAALENAMEGHVLEEARLTATYER